MNATGRTRTRMLTEFSALAHKCKDLVVRFRIVFLGLVAIVLLAYLKRPTSTLPTTVEWIDVKSRPGAITCPSDTILYRELNTPVPVEIEKGDTVKGRLPNTIYGNVHPFATKQRGIFDLPSQRVSFKRTNVDVSNKEKWSSEQWSYDADAVLKRNVDKGWVIVSLVNYAMKEMTMNYLASLILNGYDKYVVMCFDFKMYQFLAEYGFGDHIAMVPTSWMGDIDVGGEFLGWTDSKYNSMLQGKMMLVIQLLRRGFTIFYHDVDLVLTSPYVIDVLQAEDQTIGADFIYMSDAVHDSAGDVVNGGFWVAKPAKVVITWWERSLALSLRDKDNAVDQYALNNILDGDMVGLRYSRGFQKMSRTLFPSGYFVHKLQLNEKFNIYPLVVHVNWLVGNPPKKLALKKFNLWFVDDDFANPT